MRIIFGLVLAAALTACQSPEQAPPREPLPAFDILPTDEDPIFNFDRNATGPLTMEELQINLPNQVEDHLSDAQEACFFDGVERLIVEAGDPEALDPASLPYLHSAKDWDKLTKRAHRAFLASAVINHALAECVYDESLRP